MTGFDICLSRRVESRLLARLKGTAAATLSLALLSSCAFDQDRPILQPLTIDKPASAEPLSGATMAEAITNQRTLKSEDGLAAPLGRTTVLPSTLGEAPELKGESVSLNVEGIALPAFINSVFGDILNVTFEIDSAVQKRDQIVAIRTGGPLSPKDLLTTVRAVLGNYGIAVNYDNGVYRIVENATLRKDIPRIVRTRALPNVPNDMRPVFFYATLSAIPGPLMQSWLQQSFPGRLEFQNMPFGNGILLLGKADDVAAALDTIEVLDQPAMAGFKSMKISPAYWSVDKLATQLVEVLTAEGYYVAIGGNSTAAIKFIPVRALNTLIVFCTDEDVMNHVLKWVEDLDQPGQKIETKGVFYHPVFNTKAGDLAQIIGELLGDGAIGSTMNAPSQQTNATTGAMATSAGGSAEQKNAAGNRKVIVDEARNGLIFQGSPEEYAQFRGLVDQMDRAPLEVLIEATIAEVTLKSGQTLGTTLGFDDSVVPKVATSVIKSADGLVVNLVRDAGRFSAQIKALADQSRVNILSNPRVVARSGKSASIQVGTQVPIITTQQTSPTGTVGGTSALLQDVQYRNTGVSLRVTPTINSNRRVELTVSQEVSEAQVNSVSSVQSPLILTRNISTELSLSDGETVLLGGLISENVSSGENGIPFLKDIPLLGNIFKTTTRGRNRTELIILLTPYIIENVETARVVRDSFRDQLTSLPQAKPSKE